MRVQSAPKSPHFLAFFGWLVDRKSGQEEGTQEVRDDSRTQEKRVSIQ